MAAINHLTDEQMARLATGASADPTDDSISDAEFNAATQVNAGRASQLAAPGQSQVAANPQRAHLSDDEMAFVERGLPLGDLPIATPGRMVADAARAAAPEGPPPPAPPAPPNDWSGVPTVVGNQLVRGLNNLAGAVYGQTANLADLVGADTVEKIYDNLAAIQAQKAAASQTRAAAAGMPVQSGDIKNASQAAKYVAGQVAEQGTYSLPMMAAGAAAGPGAAGLLRGLGGAAAVGVPMEVTQIRQSEIEQGKEPHAGRELAYGVPAGLLEALGDVVVGRFIGGKQSKRVVVTAGEAFLRTVMKSLQAAGLNVSQEVPTEIAQTVLERAGAGKPIDDAEAFAEYKETAIAVGVSAPFIAGGAAALSEGVQAKRELEANKPIAKQVKSYRDWLATAHPQKSTEKGEPGEAPPPNVPRRPPPGAPPSPAGAEVALPNLTPTEVEGEGEARGWKGGKATAEEREVVRGAVGGEPTNVPISEETNEVTRALSGVELEDDPQKTANPGFVWNGSDAEFDLLESRGLVRRAVSGDELPTLTPSGVRALGHAPAEDQTLANPDYERAVQLHIESLDLADREVATRGTQEHDAAVAAYRANQRELSSTPMDTLREVVNDPRVLEATKANQEKHVAPAAGSALEAGEKVEEGYTERKYKVLQLRGPNGQLRGELHYQPHHSGEGFVVVNIQKRGDGRNVMVKLYEAAKAKTNGPRRGGITFSPEGAAAAERANAQRPDLFHQEELAEDLARHREYTGEGPVTPDTPPLRPGATITEEVEGGRGQGQGRPGGGDHVSSPQPRANAGAGAGIGKLTSRRVQRADEAASQYLGVPRGAVKYARGKTPDEKLRISLARDLGKAFDADVVVVSQANPGGRAAFNGFLLTPEQGDPRHTIVLNIKSDNPVTAVAGHEVVHRIGREHRDLLAPVIQIAREVADIDEWARRHGIRGWQSPSEEFVGDFTAEQLMTPGFWQRLAEKFPEAFVRLARIFMDVVDSIREAMPSGYRASRYIREVRDIERLRDAVSDMLVEYRRRIAPKVEAAQRVEDELADRRKARYATEQAKKSDPVAAVRSTLARRRDGTGGIRISEDVKEEYRKLPPLYRAKKGNTAAMGEDEARDFADKALGLAPGTTTIEQLIAMLSGPYTAPVEQGDLTAAEERELEVESFKQEQAAVPEEPEQEPPFQTPRRLSAAQSDVVRLAVEFAGSFSDPDLHDVAFFALETAIAKLNVNNRSGRRMSASTPERAVLKWAVEFMTSYGDVYRQEAALENLHRAVADLEASRAEAPSWQKRRTALEKMDRGPLFGGGGQAALFGSDDAQFEPVAKDTAPTAPEKPAEEPPKVEPGQKEFDWQTPRQPVWYHKLQRALEEKLPNRASAEQVRGVVKSGGVKDEEVEWSGLTEYLADHPTVDKAELLEYLRASQIEVTEEVLGTDDREVAAAKTAFEDAVQAAADAGARLSEITVRLRLDQIDRANLANPGSYISEVMRRAGPEQLGFIVRGNNPPSTIERSEAELAESFGYKPDEWASLDDDSRKYLLDGWRHSRGEFTQEEFDELQGATRELQLRDRDVSAARRAASQAPAPFSTYTLPGGKDYRVLLLTLPSRTTKTKLESEQELLMSRWEGTRGEERRSIELRLDALWAEIAAERTEPEYRSPHFQDTPNVLAHVRFNERVGENGKRVLFIEEIQSDWHQKGRTGGYKTGAKPGPIDTTGWKAVRDARSGLSEGAWNVYDVTGERVFMDGHASTAQEAIAFAGRWLEDQQGLGAVPNAPFKKAWPELAFKRMLRWAVENGFDQVAWTTGEQQAERYDLSKQVSGIEVTKRPRGAFEVRAWRGFPAAEWETTREGNVLEKTVSGEDELAGLIGKDLAKRAVESAEEQVRFTGLDLKVGGEGMKAFYDAMLPSAVNKYVKKWGAEVKEGKVKTGDGAAPGAHVRVHTLDITEPMRESVMGGQPLWQRRYPDAVSSDTESESFKKWFGESKVVDDRTGEPLVVYHGSFRSFKQFRRGGNEGFMGRGIYFTDEPRDASENYARLEGPDVQVKIGMATDRVSEEVPPSLRDATARRAVVGRGAGRVYPVYLRIENPVVIGGSRPTVFEYEFNEETGEKSGTLVDLYNALLFAAEEFEVDGERIWNAAGAEGLDSGSTAEEVIDALMKSEALAYVEDYDRGENASSEVIRRMFELAGYDGVIDHKPDERWGSGRRVTQMRGLTSETTHYVVFKPNQIKSVFNRGTFSTESNRIDWQTPRMTSEQEEWIADNAYGDGFVARGYEVPERVVWDVKRGDVIEMRKLDDAGYGDAPAGLYGIDVGDADFWKQKLADDYGRDKRKAKVIKIAALEGDGFLPDREFAIPDDEGNKAESFLFVTNRDKLHYGRDWVFANEDFEEYKWQTRRGGPAGERPNQWPRNRTAPERENAWGSSRPSLDAEAERELTREREPRKERTPEGAMSHEAYVQAKREMEGKGKAPGKSLAVKLLVDIPVDIARGEFPFRSPERLLGRKFKPHRDPDGKWLVTDQEGRLKGNVYDTKAEAQKEADRLNRGEHTAEEFAQRAERAWWNGIYYRSTVLDPLWVAWEKLSSGDKKWVREHFMWAYEDGKPMPNARVQKFADAWKGANEWIGQQAENLGMTVSDKEGQRSLFKMRDPASYVPHRLTDEAYEALRNRRGALYLAILTAAKTKGLDASILHEILSLPFGTKRHGSLEHPRLAELPRTVEVNGKTIKVIEDDPVVLGSHIAGATRRLAIVEQFGNEGTHDYLQAITDRIIQEGISANEAEEMVPAVWSRLQGSDKAGNPFHHTPALRKGWNILESATAAMNLSMAVIPNLFGGPLPLMVRHGVLRSAKAFVYAYTHAIGSEDMTALRRLGYLGQDLHRSLTGQDVTSGMPAAEFITKGPAKLARASLRATGFQLVNRKINEAVAYAIVRDYMPRALRTIAANRNGVLARFVGKDAKTYRTYLREQLGFSEADIDRMAAEGPTQNDLARAAGKEIENVNAMNESPVSRPPVVEKWAWRIFFAYTTYIRKFAKTVQYAVNEAKGGNVRPLTTLMVGGVITGEVIRAVRNFLKDREREDEEWYERLFQDAVEVGALGMWGIVAYAATHIGDFGHDFFSDTFMPPQAETLRAFSSAIADVVDQRDIRPLWRAFTRIAPAAGAIEAQTRRLAGDKDAVVERLAHTVYTSNGYDKATRKRRRPLDPLPGKERNVTRLKERWAKLGGTDEELIEAIKAHRQSLRAEPRPGTDLYPGWSDEEIAKNFKSKSVDEAEVAWNAMAPAQRAVVKDAYIRKLDYARRASKDAEQRKALLEKRLQISGVSSSSLQ